jgi:hypothetical protein
VAYITNRVSPGATTDKYNTPERALKAAVKK